MSSRRHPPPASIPALVAPLLATALLVAACAREEPVPSAPPDDLQTVDVAPPPDARVDPSQDRQERRRTETFSGVMPEGFPPALPLPSGASLVDQGPRWVEVLVGRPPQAVRDEYLRRVAAAGWRAVASGGGHELHRQGRTVRTRVTAAGPSTRLRIEY